MTALNPSRSHSFAGRPTGWFMRVSFRLLNADSRAAWRSLTKAPMVFLTSPDTVHRLRVQLLSGQWPRSEKRSLDTANIGMGELDTENRVKRPYLSAIAMVCQISRP